MTYSQGISFGECRPLALFDITREEVDTMGFIELQYDSLGHS